MEFGLASIEFFNPEQRTWEEGEGGTVTGYTLVIGMEGFETDLIRERTGHSRISLYVSFNQLSISLYVHTFYQLLLDFSGPNILFISCLLIEKYVNESEI